MPSQKVVPRCAKPRRGVLRTDSKSRRKHAARRCPKPTGGVLGIYVKTAEFSPTSTQFRRHVAQCFVRQHEGAPDQLRVVVDKVWKSHPGQQRDSKYLLNRLFELEKRHHLPSLDVDDPHTARPLRFLKTFRDLDAAEYRR